MAGTVRGRFDLNSRPASSSLRKLQTQGTKTDKAMRGVGRSMDQIGTPRQVRRLDVYNRKLAQIERTARRTFRTVRKEWSSSDRQVAKSVALQEKEIGRLERKLEELSLLKASPEIDVDGVATALVQVELLHKRIKALGRERVVPRIGIGATAVRATAARAGGAAGGGGGFGANPTGGMIRSLNLGPFNLGPKAWPVLGVLGIPAVTNLGGAAVGLSGSLGAGAVGAGALGIAGGGILTAAIGSIASVAVPTAGKLKEAGDALQSFQEEVLQSGRNSVEAREKWREFNRAIGQAPGGTRRLLRTRERVGKRFGRLTKPAQEDLVGILTDPLQAAGRLTPQFAGTTNRFFGAAAGASDRFFGEFATGRRSRRFLKGAGEEATMSIDEMEAITENVLGSLMNITVASRPFFREALNFLEEWTDGWLDSTDNIGKTRNSIREMVTHLKAWLRLGGATFRLLASLGSAGSGSGKGLVNDLTAQLNEWDRWIQRNPKEVRSFFRDTVANTKKLAGALGAVASSLFEISELLTPILNQFSGLVKFAGSAGLLSPGGLPLLIGGVSGIRNARRGASSRILGGGGAAGGVGGTAGAVATGAALGGGLGGRGRIFGRGGVRAFGPAPMIGTPYGPIASPSPSGRFIDAGQRAGATGGRFARGFAARAGPLVGLSALLGAISFQGNLGGRVQAGASSATLGAIPFPKTGAEKLDAAQQSVAAMTGGLTPGALGTRGTKRVVGKLRRAATSGGDFMIGTAAAGDKDAIEFGRRLVSKELKAWTQNLAQQEGTSAALDFYRAFVTRSKDKGPEAAMKATVGPALEKIRELGPKGGRVFAQNTLRWAREAKRQNPELKDEYDELADKIERRFKRMGRTIKVIHGRIYTDSSQSWSRIREIISSEAWAAESEASDAFGQLQREAFRRLRGFGFSPSQAKNFISVSGELSRTGRATPKAQARGESIAKSLPELGPMGGRGNARGGRNRFAGGGRFGGSGRNDTVPLGGGGRAAPGEFWIGNRHTERRLNTLLAPYGTSVGREIGDEKLKHSSSPLSGRAFATSMGRRFAGAGPRDFARGGRGIMAAAQLARSLGLSVGEGPGFGGVPSSGHASGSLHYSGLAYDVSGDPAAMRRYFFAAQRNFRGSINELFHDPIGWYIDNGRRVSGSIGGHSGHVHVGFFPGGAKLAGGAGSMLGAGGGKELRLGRRRSKLGGVAGMLAQASMDTTRGAMEKSINRRLGRTGGGGLGGFRGGGGPAQNMALARRMMTSFGYPPSEWSSLKALGMKESGWKTTATNPTSGAYGIPQALPAGKMASAGGDWRSNPATQIRWMLDYIKGRYGTPSSALAFHRQNNWYARGGRARRFAGSFRDGGEFLTRPGRPVLFEAGEGLEQEDVKISRRRRPGGVAGIRPRRGGGGRGTTEAHVHFHGPVSVRSDADLEAIKKIVGKGLLDALRQTDGIPEDEVIG